MLKYLSTLLLVPGLFIVTAKRTTELDLFTDVIYEPAEAWNHVDLSEATGFNYNGLTSHYTKTLNANMTFQFEGGGFVIEGLRRNASGILRLFLDDNVRGMKTDLYAQSETCSKLADCRMQNGTRTVVINLHNLSSRNLRPAIAPDNRPLELHITSIKYWSSQDEDDFVSSPLGNMLLSGFTSNIRPSSAQSLFPNPELRYVHDVVRELD